MKRFLSVLIGTVLALSGCTTESEESGESEVGAGAIAAAQAYVDAIAAGDLQLAEEMTDLPKGAPARADADVRAALPEVEDPISDPWLSVVSRNDEAQAGRAEYEIAVSYRVVDYVGGGTIRLEIDAGEDPAEVSNWRVTEPLLATTTTGSRRERVRFGGVPVRNGGVDSTEVWGYPGGYLLEAVAGSKDVDPVWVTLGADQGSRGALRNQRS